MSTIAGRQINNCQPYEFIPLLTKYAKATPKSLRLNMDRISANDKISTGLQIKRKDNIENEIDKLFRENVNETNYLEQLNLNKYDEEFKFIDEINEDIFKNTKENPIIIKTKPSKTKLNSTQSFHEFRITKPVDSFHKSEIKNMVMKKELMQRYTRRFKTKAVTSPDTNGLNNNNNINLHATSTKNISPEQSTILFKSDKTNRSFSKCKINNAKKENLVSVKDIFIPNSKKSVNKLSTKYKPSYKLDNERVQLKLIDAKIQKKVNNLNKEFQNFHFLNVPPAAVKVNKVKRSMSYKQERDKKIMNSISTSISSRAYSADKFRHVLPSKIIATKLESGQSSSRKKKSVRTQKYKKNNEEEKQSKDTSKMNVKTKKSKSNV